MLTMLLEGFGAVFTPQTMLWIVLGVTIGIIFGSLPGLSATMAIALFIPMTFKMDVSQGIATLVALYIGGMSGGLISAILINIPGTPASIATCFDGHPMVCNGQAGKALGTGIICSFLGGMIGILILMFVAPSLAAVTLQFGPVEYFAISVFSLTLIAGLTGKSLIKGLISGLLGMLMAMVGAAPIDNTMRYTFGSSLLMAGFSLLPVMIGIFAVTEVLMYADKRQNNRHETQKPAQIRMDGILDILRGLKGQVVNIVRSALMGTGIGLLPGLGGNIASLMSYTAAKNTSKHPEKFGTGIVDGIVASESANNAVIGGAMIPLLTLGIPGDTATAMILGGFTIHGITPGPLLFKTQGALVYAIFAALILSNIVFLVLELAGIKVFAKVLNLEKNILLAVVMMLCVVGAYGNNNNTFDVLCVAVFGILGYFLIKNGFPAAPFIMGFILCPIAELNLRKGIMFEQGSVNGFLWHHPIALAFYAVAIAVVGWTVYKEIRKLKKKAE